MMWKANGLRGKFTALRGGETNRLQGGERDPAERCAWVVNGKVKRIRRESPGRTSEATYRGGHAAVNINWKINSEKKSESARLPPAGSAMSKLGFLTFDTVSYNIMSNVICWWIFYDQHPSDKLRSHTRLYFRANKQFRIQYLCDVQYLMYK